MKKALKVLALMLLLGAAIGFWQLQHRENVESTGSMPEMGEQEGIAYQKLLKLRRHLDPASPEGIRVAEQIAKMERRRAGYAKAEKPDEFARILYERRIPEGETRPQYPLNYKLKALQKARSASKTGGDILPWVERGPANVSGRARGLVLDPDDPTGNTWFVGSVGGGIWKTEDAGANWINLTPDLPTLAVSVVVMSASNPDVMYAGTGESMFSVDVINGDGIFKSIDRGQSWFQLSATADNPKFNNISRMLVDPQNPDIVLASTTAGRYKLGVSNTSNIFKSTDGGQTWTEVYNETSISGGRVKKVLQLVETPGNFNVLYAAVDEKGVLKSTDAGDNWFLASSGISSATGRFELAVSPSNPAKIYAAMEGSPTQLYVTGDAAQSWQLTSEPGGPDWLSGQGWYDNTIVVHPTNENRLYVGGVRLYQIDVNGTSRSTSQLSTGPVHVDHHNLMIIPRQGGSFRILNANDGGLGVSQDSSRNWLKPTDGMNTSQFYGVDKKPGASAYVGGMQDNGTWRSPENSDAQVPWTFQIGGDGYETSWHFNDPLKVIGGSQYNGLARSLDGGISYSSATDGLGDTGSGNAPFITKIGKTNLDPDLLFAVGRRGVWRSTDFGASWSLRSIPSSTWGSISSFLDIRVSRATADIVWAGSRMDGGGDIHVSTDRGLTFTPVNDYGAAAAGTISGLSTHPTEDSTAYVMFSFAQKAKIIRTTDLGQTWEDITGFATDTISTNGFPDVAVYDLLVMPHTPDTLWAGTEIGLFESTDNGASWHYADNGLPAVAIWAMTHVEEEVVLATHGRGIWSVNIPGLSRGQTFNPLIKELFQGPSGDLSVGVGLRSAYDSSQVVIDGTPAASIPGNGAPLDTLFEFPVVSSGNLTVQVNAYRAGAVYASVSKTIDVVAIAAPQASYVTDFESGNDFTGSGFQVRAQSGFTGTAIHTSHPYADAATLTYTLNIPIIVAASDAFIAFDEVALVEPGDPGSRFGDSNFWDYVVVEGSRDGSTWIPIADGYDARDDAAWLTAYNNGTSGSETLMRNRQLDLHAVFAAGETVLIRFRLFADAFVTGWGWAIDNLEIQARLTGIAGASALPESFALSQNYPNPFNPSTTIAYQLPAAERVTIEIYNVLGQRVRQLVNGYQPAGRYTLVWDGRNEAGEQVASGVYLYRMHSGSYLEQRKMTLLK